MPTSEGDGGRLQRIVDGVGVLFAGAAVVGVAAIPFVVPAVVAWFALGAAAGEGTLVDVVVFSLVYIALAAVLVGLYEAVGLFDLENATGRVPPRR